jgi:hypothetical protein
MRPITPWHKSSYSLNEDNFCVETAQFPDGRTGVRDSKVTCGPVLLMPTTQWTTFVQHRMVWSERSCSGSTSVLPPL